MWCSKVVVVVEVVVAVVVVVVVVGMRFEKISTLTLYEYKLGCIVHTAKK